MNTLLGHLASCRFTTQVEDLATEALGYILKRSVAARGAVNRHVARFGRSLPSELFYSTQLAGAEQARPDIVGKTHDGSELLLIEAKFWAGLTRHQPLTYLQRLPPGGVLLFVAPEARVASCWSELLLRCSEAGLTVASLDVPEGELRTVALADTKTLALTSWRRLLDDLRHATQDPDEAQALQDVIQLQGMCEQQDQTAFLPLRYEELNASPFRRFFDFERLPGDALTLLEQRGFARRSGRSGKSQAFAFSGYYLQLRGVPVHLSFDLTHWLIHGMTPIWLTLPGSSSEKKLLGGGIFDSLDYLRRQSPARLFESSSGLALVPIHLPVGVEQDRVVLSIVEQVEAIGERIAHLASLQSTGAQSAPTPESEHVPDSPDAALPPEPGPVASGS